MLFSMLMLVASAARMQAGSLLMWVLRAAAVLARDAGVLVFTFMAGD
jgi:hypothetical protein